jgi:hypothetical protein
MITIIDTITANHIISPEVFNVSFVNIDDNIYKLSYVNTQAMYDNPFTLTEEQATVSASISLLDLVFFIDVLTDLGITIKLNGK